MNKSLGNLLICLAWNTLGQWDSILPQVEFAFNNSVNQSTRLNPFHIVYGKSPKGLTDLVERLNKIDDVDAFSEQIQGLHEHVRE